MLFVFDHLAVDGWSYWALLEELGALLDGRERAAATRDVATYREYVAWQRAWLDTSAARKQLDYWTVELAGELPLLDFLSPHAGLKTASYRRKRSTRILDAALTDGVRQLAQRHGTTIFTVLLCAYQVLLHRYSGQNTIVVGTPLPARIKPRWHGVVGDFVNPISMVGRFSADPSVAQALQATRDAVRRGMAAHQYPFAALLEKIGVRPEARAQAVFQTMFAFHRARRETPLLPLWMPGTENATVRWGGMELSHYPAYQAGGYSDLPLVLHALEFEDCIGCDFSFDPGLLGEDAIQRMSAHLEGLLAAMVESDDQALSRLEMLDPAERRQLLDEFNPALADTPQDDFVHCLFKKRAQLQPDSTALECAGRHVSYGELDAWAEAIADDLGQHGVRPGDHVALLVERGCAMVAALLGILKSGATYVPLHTSFPSERLADILDDCRPAAIIAHASLAARLPLFGGPLIDLSDDIPRVGTTAQDTTKHPSQAAFSKDLLAYVMYTSGSTGRPKGVMAEHRQVASFLSAMASALGITGSDRVLATTTLSFDPSCLELYLPLMLGATVVIADSTTVTNPAALAHLIETARVTLMQATPTTWRMLLDAGWSGAPVTLLTGGEALSADFAQRLRERCSALWNLYGPTETTVWCTACRVEPQSMGLRVPIGRPIANTRIYILDPHGQPVPVGVAGEIHIGGAGVARGYLHRPDLTAQRFVPDPFDARPGARMYKTGDLGRWRPDGQIDFLGRNDFQVKIRGFRIELGEIETRLSACDGVREAVVLARDDPGGLKRLLAYVQPEPGASPSALQLREQLATRLPEYMLPAAFVTVQAWPLTPSGKLDRLALPEPDAQALASRAHEPPQGTLECTIAALWQELLGAPLVGRHDNFFDLGGHSLLAVQLVSRMRSTIGCELPLREVFSHPTLLALAQAAQRCAGGERSTLVPIRTQGTGSPLFLVHPGEGEIAYAWALTPCLEGGMPVYALAAPGFLEGELPLRSVPDLARHHIANMRRVQPHGPYRLAGWSAGGTIAYEIAHQLVGIDEPVQFLGLIDTTSSYHVERRPWADELLAQLPAEAASQVSALVDWISHHTPQISDDDLVCLLREESFDAAVARCQVHSLLPDIDDVTLRRHLRVRAGILEALMEYALPPLSLRVHLITAADEIRDDPAMGWEALAGRKLTHESISGRHYTIVSPPHVDRLGQALSRAMRDAARSAAPIAEKHYSPVITIQTARFSRPPLFCIPGAGASVTSFFPLAQSLPAELTVYGLQPRGLDGTMAPHIDAVSAAAFYVEAIRATAARGPYHLLGHSYGGWVAFETARQLTAAGQSVASLILLDSQVPKEQPSPMRRRPRIDTLQELIDLYEQLANGPLKLDRARLLQASHREQIDMLRTSLVAAGIMPAMTTSQALRGLFHVFDTNVNDFYAPDGAYPGLVHLAFVDDSPQAREGWRQFAPQAVSRGLTGNHMTLLNTPCVVELAKWIASILNGGTAN